MRGLMVVLVGVALGGIACEGPFAQGETSGKESTSTTTASSSRGAEADAEGSTAASSSSEGPSRPVPAPFELPEGCGDGVVVSGQYDCFAPIPFHFPGLTPSVRGDGHDVDGDGRDELVVDTYPLRLVAYDDEAGFVLGVGAEFASNSYDYHWRWDWDGDGRKDLTTTPVSGEAMVFANTALSMSFAGSWTTVHDWGELYASEGKAVPIDVDGDGQLELVVSHRLEPQWLNSPTEIAVRRRVGDEWQTSGPTFPFGGCGWLARHAFGDVDGDGDEDVIIEDEGTGCDPHPFEYDPEWYRVGVFLVDSAVGELQLAGWFPTGGVSNATWIEVVDADDDGLADVVLNISDGRKTSVGFLRGHGDGTFDEGVQIPRDRPGLPPWLVLRMRGDFDGDGDVEWLAMGPGPVDSVQLFVIESPLHEMIVTPFVTVEDPAAGYSHSVEHSGTVDFNGDGVDDVLMTVNLAGPGGFARHALISAP